MHLYSQAISQKAINDDLFFITLQPTVDTEKLIHITYRRHTWRTCEFSTLVFPVIFFLYNQSVNFNSVHYTIIIEHSSREISAGQVYVLPFSEGEIVQIFSKTV